LSQASFVGAELAPGAIHQGTATSFVTQAQVDAGLVGAETFFALYYPQVGSTVIRSTSGWIALTRAPELAFEKTVSQSVFYTGTELTYTFEVSNTGNVTLEDVVIDVIEFTGAGRSAALGQSALQVGTIAPGQTFSAEEQYTANEADVTQGFIAKAAEARAHAACGAVLTVVSDSLIQATPGPAFNQQAPGDQGAASSPEYQESPTAPSDSLGSQAAPPGNQTVFRPGGTVFSPNQTAPGSGTPTVWDAPAAKAEVAEAFNAAPAGSDQALALSGANHASVIALGAGLMLMGFALLARRGRRDACHEETSNES